MRGTLPTLSKVIPLFTLEYHNKYDGDDDDGDDDDGDDDDGDDDDGDDDDGEKKRRPTSIYTHVQYNTLCV
jgi:hypothetical protein